jgi:hypothetical protein
MGKGIGSAAVQIFQVTGTGGAHPPGRGDAPIGEYVDYSLIIAEQAVIGDEVTTVLELPDSLKCGRRTYLYGCIGIYRELWHDIQSCLIDDMPLVA